MPALKFSSISVTAFLVAFIGSSLSANQASAQSMTSVELAQIAKLELYLKEVEKGYGIMQTGLTTIAQIKQGDFDLHALFFSTLKNVNPAIKNWGKVADILAMQIQIILGCATTLKTIVSDNSFNSTDIKYLTNVYSDLKGFTEKDIDELTSIITDGNWQMNDEDRMGRIDKLFNRVSEKYLFLRSFSNRVMQEAQIRTQEKNSLQFLSKLFQP